MRTLSLFRLPTLIALFALQTSLWPQEPVETPDPAEEVYWEMVRHFQRSEFEEALPVAEKLVSLREAQKTEHPLKYLQSLTYLREVHKMREDRTSVDSINRRMYGTEGNREESVLSELIELTEEPNELGQLSFHGLLGGAFELAAEAAEKVAQAQPGEPPVWTEGTRAHAYLFLGRMEEAIEIYQKYRTTDSKANIDGSDLSWEQAAEYVFDTMRSLPAMVDEDVELRIREAEVVLGLRASLESISDSEMKSQMVKLREDEEYEEALALARKRLELLEPQAEVRQAGYADVLSDLAHIYNMLSNAKKAEQHYLKALEIREDLDPESWETAHVISALARLYWSTNRLQEAEPLLDRAIKIKTAKEGPNHFLTAVDQMTLATIYHKTGRNREAETLLKQALPNTKAVNASVARVALFELANVYTELARFHQAEPIFLHYLALQEKALGPEHPGVAYTCFRISKLYQRMGNHSRAASLLKRALVINEATLGPDHPATASALVHLAQNLFMLGHRQESAELSVRAYQILEKAHGAEHPDTASALSFCASQLNALGEYEKAEQLYIRVLELGEQIHGPDHSFLRTPISNLAGFYVKTGRPDLAEELYQRALRISESSLGSRHPSTASELSGLASVYASMGRPKLADEYSMRSLELTYRHSQQVVAHFGENALIHFGSSLQYAHLAGNEARSSTQLLSQLWFKGLVAEEMGRRKREVLLLSRVPGGPETVREMDQLRTQIHTLSLRQGEDAPEVENLVNQFNEKRRQAQDLLGENLSGDQISLTLEETSRHLSSGQVLAETFRYWHRLERETESRYQTVLLSPSGETISINHGSAKTLEADIAQYRKLSLGLDPSIQALTLSQRDTQIREVSHRLYEAFLEPLLSQLEIWQADTLILSLDAQLHFLPVGMLLDATGEEAQIAAQKLNIRYVSSGRDLARQPEDPAPSHMGSAGLLLTNPTYDRDQSSEETVKIASTASLGLDEPHLGTALLSGYGQDTKSIHFRPTSGLLALQSRLPELFANRNLELLTLAGTEANEAALHDEVVGQRVVHLATHGFFLQELEVGKNGPALETISFSEEERRGPVVVQNPMYRSGLALAGANDTLNTWANYESGGTLPNPSQDGMLLAAEAAALDLSGTDVLFLGACETAVGDALDGEGVMGLRRALAIAGARNTILTLWSVQDQPTVEFTERFYTKYLDGMSAATALAETQKELYAVWLDQHGYAEAVNRAGAFICTSLGPIDPIQVPAEKPSSEGRPWWKFW